MSENIDHQRDEQCQSPGGYLPPHIADWMGDRNILTVCLDIVGGVRGGRDMCLSDCATWLGCVEWYIDHWTPSDCPFDAIVLQMLKHAQGAGNEWFMRESAKAGL